MSNIGAVIGWKHNHQAGMSTRAGVITEFPGGIPSQADQDAWTAEYEAHVAATAYKDDRKSSYPTIGDQLDMLWHAIDTGNWTAAKVKTTDFYTELKAVKDANPKPEGD